MPTGTGVVDAFKSLSHASLLMRSSLTPRLGASDLIRHGKNHHSARPQDDASYQHTYTQPQMQQQQQQQQQQRAAEQQSRHDREVQQQQQQQTQKHASPKYKEQVEQIVQEEREAKGKMPVYKGLENYKLVEKMGE